MTPEQAAAEAYANEPLGLEFLCEMEKFRYLDKIDQTVATTRAIEVKAFLSGLAWAREHAKLRFETHGIFDPGLSGTHHLVPMLHLDKANERIAELEAELAKAKEQTEDERFGRKTNT